MIHICDNQLWFHVFVPYLLLGSFSPQQGQGLSELEQIEKELQGLSEKERELRNKKQSTNTEITEESSATGMFPELQFKGAVCVLNRKS